MNIFKWWSGEWCSCSVCVMWWGWQFPHIGTLMRKHQERFWVHCSLHLVSVSKEQRLKNTSDPHTSSSNHNNTLPWKRNEALPLLWFQFGNLPPLHHHSHGRLTSGHQKIRHHDVIFTFANRVFRAVHLTLTTNPNSLTPNLTPTPNHSTFFSDIPLGVNNKTTFNS